MTLPWHSLQRSRSEKKRATPRRAAGDIALRSSLYRYLSNAESADTSTRSNDAMALMMFASVTGDSSDGNAVAKPFDITAVFREPREDFRVSPLQAHLDGVLVVHRHFHLRFEAPSPLVPAKRRVIHDVDERHRRPRVMLSGRSDRVREAICEGKRLLMTASARVRPVPRQSLVVKQRSGPIRLLLRKSGCRRGFSVLETIAARASRRTPTQPPAGLRRAAPPGSTGSIRQPPSSSSRASTSSRVNCERG